MSNTIKIGTNNINAIKLGSIDVDAVYLGTNLVYTSTPPTPSSKKLQLTYSDSSTYDIDCDTATTLTSLDVQGGSSSYTAITSAEIGDCVSTIGDNAFYGCSGLTSCTIGSGVTTIGNQAFRNCSGLTSIDIPNSVTTIGVNAFMSCTNLTTCTIGNGVTSIGKGVFYGCSGLTEITVNASTPPTLGKNVFGGTNNCPIYVPAASVEAYKAASGWSDYASRIQAIPTPQSSCYEIVSIPITSYTSTTYDSVYSASDEKWYMKNNLNQYEEYGIYETGTSLSDFTYYDGKLTAIGTTEYQWDGSQWQNVGVYESSETTWTIDNTDPSPYEGETLSTSFKIPKEDISEIGFLDFSISLLSGRLMINSDEYTYENDDSGEIEEGTITDDGTYLNFSLPTTKEVVVEGIEYWESTPIHLIMEDKEISVEYSAKTVSTNEYQSVAEMEAVGCPTVGVGQYGFVGNDIYKYTNNEEWVGTSLQDPKMVAFYSSGTPLVVYNNSDTTLSSGETKTSTLPIEVYVGNSVTLIDELAFYDCKSISACTIGSGVTTIGNSAFRDCSSLTSIVIPSSVTTINSMAFYGCSGLTTCTISNGVTSIGDSAFGNCKSLTSVTIPNSVISIGTSAFQNCSGLTSIDIPNSVTSINSFAFSNTPWWNSYSADTSHQYGNIIYINDVAYAATSTGITSCTFKEGSLSIGGGAFWGCKSLTSIDIPNSVTTIGNNAFNNCSGLTTCTIGSGVTTIGNGAFNNCKKLTSVTIPNSVISIGTSAFQNCSGLTSIDIPNSVTSINSMAFYNCSGLTTCNIGSGVTTIGNYAFNYCSGLTAITVNATEPPSLGYGALDNTSCPILVPSEAVETYKAATNWSTYASRIQAIPT